MAARSCCAACLTRLFGPYAASDSHELPFRAPAFPSRIMRFVTVGNNEFS